MPVEQALGFRIVGHEKLLVAMAPGQSVVFQLHVQLRFQYLEKLQERGTVRHAAPDVKSLPADARDIFRRREVTVHAIVHKKKIAHLLSVARDSERGAFRIALRFESLLAEPAHPALVKGGKL